MAEKSSRSAILTPEFRLAFPVLFEPKPPKDAPNGEKKFRLVCLFPTGCDLNELQQHAMLAGVELWGPDATKWPSGWKNPFRDQGEKTYEGYVKGALFISASTKERPGIVDRNVKPIIDPSEIYPGCYGRAYVRAFAYDKAGNRGIAFGLQHFQKTRDGDPINGRERPEAVFAPVGGESVATMPAGGVDPKSIFG